MQIYRSAARSNQAQSFDCQEISRLENSWIGEGLYLVEVESIGIGTNV